MKRLIFGGIIGAALVYFFDPERGKRRRQEAMDRIGSTAKGQADSMQDLTQRATAKAQGVATQAAKKTSGVATSNDDATLTEKVKTELYGKDPETKGRVSINVQNGFVQLRGELDQPEQIKAAVKTAGSVDGVSGVENLLHLPNTAAPKS